MSDDSLLGKADQLMRRHRSFVASPKPEDIEIQDVKETEDSNEDLPVLTEVVATAADPESALQLRLAQLLAEQRAAMLREFERWLDEQLAQVVVNAMDGITDRLIALITKRAHAELLPRLEAIAAGAVAAAAQGNATDAAQSV